MGIQRQECRMEGKKYSVPEGQDRLVIMMVRQEKFAKRFGLTRNMPPAKVDYWIKELCQCLSMEIAELLEEVNWKHWKKAKKKIDLEAARMEVVDEFKFVMSKAIALSMTADDIYQYDSRKAEINEQRQKDKY